LKRRFPDAKISVLVTSAALSTGGISREMFIERLKVKKLQASPETVETDILESALGDHYIEFGGGGRSAGKRVIGGIIISI